MLEHKTCGKCEWATRFKDGLHCVDGQPVDPKDDCFSWQPDDGTKWQQAVKRQQEER